ncbi:hypothetical protein [Oceanobacter sp. 3_MG-2023]|uniref:hypothetical protein n=1 Tax=Oceanobacter sp. 3_MG-2023 TaxID=3062622 RepID=UPI002733A838|nr:hypothetical protein [Oceanobacter sp. 3_MG-2023]MDP2505409.1 hypothetical protein [Oceanobacter sp. 3_MG-2023]
MNLVKKSQTTSLFLTILLGPLGAFYGSPIGALILCVIAIVTAPTIVGPVICWILAIFVSDSGVNKHNKSIDIFLSNKKD